MNNLSQKNGLSDSENLFFQRIKYSQSIQEIWIYMTIILIYVFSPNLLYSQEQDQQVFYGEYNQQSLKIAILPEKWPMYMDSFKIRQKVNGEWRELHAGFIVPEIKQKKHLNNVTSDQLRDKIELKRDSLIDQSKLREVNHSMMINALLDSLQLISFKMFLGSNFDLLLSSGLGVESFPNEGFSEIGLFDATEKIVQVLRKEKITNPEYPLNIESSIEQKGNNLSITWKIDINKYSEQKVLKGFNIYKQKSHNEIEKINEVPIYMNRKGEHGYIYHHQKTKNDSTTFEFTLRPVTIFNTEGNENRVRYDPSIGTVDQRPLQININTGSEAGRSRLSWNKKTDYELMIVEWKDEPSSEWKQLDMIREKIDFYEIAGKTINGAYTSRSGFFRIQWIKGESAEFSNIMVYYPPKKPLISPVLKSAQLELKPSPSITLVWEPYQTDQFKGMQLLTSSNTDSTFYSEGSIPLITDHTFQWDLPSSVSGNILIGIKAIMTDGRSSKMSNIIEVKIPPRELPEVIITKVQRHDSTLIFNFDYPNSIPVESFLIYKNGNHVKTVSGLERVVSLKAPNSVSQYNITATLLGTESCLCQNLKY